MPSTPPFLLGRHLIVQVASLIIDESTGAITPGAFVALSALLDAYHGETTLRTETISPLGSQNRNPVPLESGTVFEITEIMRNGVSPSTLRTLFASSSYFAFRITEGAGAPTMNCYALCTKLGRAAGKGKNTITARLESIDIGTANPWFI